LVGLGEDAARAALRSALRAPARPATPPLYPGGRAGSPTPPFPGSLPAAWTVPPRNRLFTGRTDIITRIDPALNAHDKAARHGMPGVGKTQTAIEYAHKRCGIYQAVVWVVAETADSLNSALLGMARSLSLPGLEELSREDILERARLWLQNNTGWLLLV